MLEERVVPNFTLDVNKSKPGIELTGNPTLFVLEAGCLLQCAEMEYPENILQIDPETPSPPCIVEGGTDLMLHGNF